MTLISLHHIQLAMPKGGENTARNFYEGLLGLAEVPKPRELAKRGGVWFELGNIGVHLGVEDGFRPARKAHPAFQVSDLETLFTRLYAANVPLKRDDALPDYNRFYADDPFGNRIEFLQPK